MSIILNIVIPMFAIIGLGAVAERLSLLGKDSVKVINHFVYYFPLPVLLFGSMATEPFNKINNTSYLIAFTLGMLLTFAITFAGFKFIKRDDSLAYTSIKSLGASLPNAGYIGIPLLLSIAGPKALLPAALATVLVFIMVALSIFLIELDLHAQKSIRTVARKVFITLLKNPLIMASLLGVLYSFLGISMPPAAINFYQFFGAAAAPCALFAIGQTLAQQRFTNLYELGLISILKLILHPLLTFFLLVLFKVNPLWIIAGTILAGLPTGAVKYMIAQHYHFYERESSSLILLSTLLSILTLSILLIVLHLLWPTLLVIQ